MDIIWRYWLGLTYGIQFICKGGLFSTISDRGSPFTSHFWRSLQRTLGTRVDLSTIFHLQTNSQSEMTMQVLQFMLWACVIYYGGHQDQFFPLAQFSFYNNFYFSIQIELFEAFYVKRCRYRISQFDAFKARPQGMDMFRDSLDKVKLFNKWPYTAQSKQKCYMN